MQAAHASTIKKHNQSAASTMSIRLIASSEKAASHNVDNQEIIQKAIPLQRTWYKNERDIEVSPGSYK